MKGERIEAKRKNKGWKEGRKIGKERKEKERKERKGREGKGRKGKERKGNTFERNTLVHKNKPDYQSYNPTL